MQAAPSANGTIEAPAALASQITPRNAFLDYLTKPAPKLPNRVILHATEGWGKSSFAAHAPSPVFLMTRGETGLWTLMNSGRLPEGIAHFPQPASTWTEALQAIAQLGTQQHPFRTLVLDTLNGIERLLHEHICHEHFAGDWGENGFTAYQRGYRVAIPDFLAFLKCLDILRDNGMSIILLCHTCIQTFKNPEGADYDRYVPALAKETWSEAHRWADLILFGARTANVTAKGKASKGKAQGGQQRLIYTERTAAYDAKNRHGLPASLPCGDSPQQAWNNFYQALKK